MIGAIKALLVGLAELFSFLKDRQLINAGKAEEQRDAMVTREKRVAEASAARSDSAKLDELRDKRLRD